MRAIIFVLITVAAASAQDRKEAALGAQLAKEVRQRTTAIENPAVLDYVELIGRRLAPHLGNAAYTFALIADADIPTHEPLSFPGGYIFVSTELIRSATDEAELAGMLAHAMAHVTLPPARSDNANTIPVIFMGGGDGLGLKSSGSLVPMSLLETQRENESRSDVLAVQAMSEVGYDPESLVRYVARVQQPIASADARIAALRQVIAELPARTYSAADADEFALIQERVRNIVPQQREPVRPALRRQN